MTDRESRALEFMRARSRDSRGRGCYWCDRIPEEARIEIARCVAEGYARAHIHEWIQTEFATGLAAMPEPYRRRQSLHECLRLHRDAWSRYAT